MTGDAVPEGARRPTLPTPASDTPATVTQASNVAPDVHVFAGDIDLLPPRFGSDSNLNADDWVTDFRAYVRVQKIPPNDAIVVFRTRMSGTARQWIETIPDRLS